jgi:hypothetical protein
LRVRLTDIEVPYKEVIVRRLMSGRRSLKNENDGSSTKG